MSGGASIFSPRSHEGHEENQYLMECNHAPSLAVENRQLNQKLETHWKGLILVPLAHFQNVLAICFEQMAIEAEDFELLDDSSGAGFLAEDDACHTPPHLDGIVGATIPRIDL